jgi:hypothetical protein
MATPLLTATPTTPPTYNPSMADTYSWVPVEGANRPLFARTVYPIGGAFQDPLATIITLLQTLTAQNA